MLNNSVDLVSELLSELNNNNDPSSNWKMGEKEFEELRNGYFNPQDEDGKRMIAEFRSRVVAGRLKVLKPFAFCFRADAPEREMSPVARKSYKSNISVVEYSTMLNQLVFEPVTAKEYRLFGDPTMQNCGLCIDSLDDLYVVEVVNTQEGLKFYLVRYKWGQLGVYPVSNRHFDNSAKLEIKPLFIPEGIKLRLLNSEVHLFLFCRYGQGMLDYDVTKVDATRIANINNMIYRLNEESGSGVRNTIGGDRECIYPLRVHYDLSDYVSIALDSTHGLKFQFKQDIDLEVFSRYLMYYYKGGDTIEG